MKLETAFKHQDYEIVKDDVLYQGFITLKRYQIKTKKYQGGWTHVFKREVAERRSAIAVLPYDPVLDKIMLIEQFRVGALADKESPWLLEIVAGVIEEGETPETVARREAQEEAGVTISDLHFITDYFVSPGASNEHLTLFCGRIDASAAGGVFGLPEEEEDIRAIVLDIKDALQLIEDKKIKTAPAFASLLWLKQHHEWLKQKWLTN